MENAVELPDESEDNPLWAYALSAWGKAGVENTCCALQDDYNLNVNFLLYCCWMATQSIKISEAELLQQIKELRYWDHEVVLPLRQARRALGKIRSAEVNDLKEKVKACELDAEKVFHDEIYGSFCKLNKIAELIEPAELEKKNIVLTAVSNKKDLDKKENEELAARNRHFSAIALHNLEHYTAIFGKAKAGALKKNMLTLIGLLEE